MRNQKAPSVNLRIFAKHLLVADSKDLVSLPQRGKVPPDFQIGKEADEVLVQNNFALLLRKITTHPPFCRIAT